jgi:predicted HicB family RNase H-like nuclease
MMKYRGYVARTEIDTESDLIFGEVVGLRDMITFQGQSVAEAVDAFRESVELYLRTCAEQGLEPERPYSGSIAVRTTPRVHRALVALAKARGQSLNELVARVLTRAVRHAGLETSASPGPEQGRAADPSPPVQARPGTEPGDAPAPITQPRRRGAKAGRKAEAKGRPASSSRRERN